MFSITVAGVNRLDIVLDGKLSKADMRKLLDDYVEKSEGMTDGVMLYRIEAFAMPEPAALAVEFARLPKLIKTLARFNKVAVISDKNWIKRVGEWEGKLIPGLAIKSFSPEEVAAAEAWLSG
ncbi:STAS/SEC14 domain-containing protein [bacterium]|nr:STAS/SEC14 domain-containing protein [bacterium]